jgi:diguanylate cyclase (GGDEF)-like protein/PAS domain S-box-containing protein
MQGLVSESAWREESLDTKQGNEMQMSGEPTAGANLLRRAFGWHWIPWLLLGSLSACLQAQGAGEPTRVLRTVHEVSLMRNAEASLGFPVVLLGVVTYSDPEWGLLFIRDATGSIYINVHGSSIRYPLGTRLSVDGVTAPGDIGPIVAHAKIKVLGSGASPIPDVETMAELDNDNADSRWVVTEGVLHVCHESWTRVCFRIFDGKTIGWVIVPEAESPAAQRLVGSTVRVKGVCGAHLDKANKRVGAQLFVNSLSDILPESPVLEDPFSSPVMAIESVNAAYINQRFASPVHLRGVVTWASPHGLFVQDSSGAAYAKTDKPVAVRAGNALDLVGFPGYSEYGLTLSDPLLRPVASPNAVQVAPLDLTAGEIIKRSLNGWQVHLRARLITQSANDTGVVYQLEDEDQHFTATLLQNDAARQAVNLTRNSVLEVTGVAVVRKGTAEWPDSLLVLITSPADIVVLGESSWLTLRRGLLLLCGILIALVTPLLWIRMLRRTVRKQTGIIRARLENELQLETKHRRLFERNLAAVFLWRPDGAIIDCNMAFVNLLGYSKCEELIGQSYWDFLVDSAQRENLCAALAKEGLSNQEASLRRSDGVMVHLLTNITPVTTPEGMVYETTAIDITQLRQNQAELQKARDAAVHDALNDPLTGLPNRRLLSDRLASHMIKSRNQGRMFALIYIDLDGFKLVNDSLGHSVGDAVLIQLANRLQSRIREEDFLSRLGGDEFVVILDKLHVKEDAARVAEDLLLAISNPFHVEGHELAIGASIGVAIFPECAGSAEELIKEADSAMYTAKREGKNRVMNYTPEIGSAIHERLTIENQLRGAIQREELFLNFQPEFELDSGRLVRFEALARWTHPTLGRIPPDKFIPIAEDSGMIVGIGAYVMERACAEAVRWQRIMPYPVQVAVNVSTIQFRRKGFMEEVVSILERTGLSPSLLQLELTESVMMNGAHLATNLIGRFRTLGVSLAIDDFGTGYSNLSYLPSMRFDVLKIDRSFVMNLEQNPTNESMIRTLVALAHNVGMRVIVEGVETQEQLGLIRSLGVNGVQGYLLGRPTVNPIEDFLRKLPECLRFETPQSPFVYSAAHTQQRAIRAD